jgi:hypothetical protein
LFTKNRRFAPSEIQPVFVVLPIVTEVAFPTNVCAVGAEIVRVGTEVYLTPLFVKLTAEIRPIEFEDAFAAAAVVKPEPPLTVIVAFAL